MREEIAADLLKPGDEAAFFTDNGDGTTSLYFLTESQIAVLAQKFLLLDWRLRMEKGSVN